MSKYLIIYRSTICAFFILMGISLNAQILSSEESITRATITECYEWSRANFPLIKQLDIIDKVTHYSLANVSNGKLPQINLNGQATYQSAVTTLPIENPNIVIPTINKDQYKIYGEVYQPLTNFYNINTRKKQLEVIGKIEKQKVEVNLHQLKDRINQTYFSVLLINEKIKQYEIIIADLDSAIVKVDAAIDNGTATLTDNRLINVERLSIKQKIKENKSNELSLLNILTLLTGKYITKSTILENPKMQQFESIISRPELQLFKLQNEATYLQSELLNKSLRPNLGLFAQGGYGRPALNFLSNEFDFYYIGGIKFNWNISNLFNHNNSKNLLQTSRDKIAIQQETFLLNTELTQSQQSAEIIKFKGLMVTDDKIIEIREEILSTAKVQLDNGLITTIDYIKHLNEVNMAKQTLLLHETQHLLALYNLRITTGN